MHVEGYVHGLRAHPDSEIVGLWDDDVERAETFAQKHGIPFVGFLKDLLDAVDAVVITSENVVHVELVEAAAAAGKDILCEKPLGASEAHLTRIQKAVDSAGVNLMTAFPCRFSPAFQRLKQRVRDGEIGPVRAIDATNRGRCPFGWFVDAEKSGGGAMIDHVVHVTDLLRDLLGEEPVRVQAQVGNNTYGQCWEDTAMVTIEFPSGIFASLDSSWSRPQNYKTWGDVTMTVVGDRGVIEMDMFGPAVEVYGKTSGYSAAGFGADLDALLVEEFVRSCLDKRPPRVTGFDGAQAARVALAGYASVETGQPVQL
jgi:predicted dehydrogenase